tara:strand:- start:46 stop:519 length:474 start_codon:yes stop_codon:yes gene_type:complete
MITDIVKSLKSEFKSNEIWMGSEYEWMYNLTPKVKGMLGEKITYKLFEENGYAVNINKTFGWDLNITEMKVEVKLSMLNKTGLFKFLQIRPNDNYTHILFLCIEPNDINIFLVPKNKVKGLKPQHSGNRGSKETMYLGITPTEMKKTYENFNLFGDK